MTLADFGLTHSSVTALIILYLSLFILIFSCILALFYIKGFGIYKISRKLKIKRSWYGFLPFANIFAFGRISDVTSKKKSHYGAWLTFLYSVSRILMAVFVVLGIIFAVKLLFAADKALFEEKELDAKIFKGLLAPVLCLLLSALFNLFYWIVNTFCAVRVYRLFGASHPVAFAVLGLFIPILFPCFVNSVCKNDPTSGFNEIVNDDTAVFSVDG